MKSIIKQLLREVLIENYNFENEIDISILKDLVSQYPELVKYYRSIIGDEFKVGNSNLYDKNDKALPWFTFQYQYEPNTGEPRWFIDKNDYTPLGRDRYKRILETKDINEVYKLMIKSIKNLLAHLSY